MSKTGAMLLLIWTVIIVGAVLFVGQAATKTVVYTGSELTFDVGSTKNFAIEGSTVSIEAASDTYFLLRQPNGENLISAHQTEPPVGWDGAYFVYNNENLHDGEWIVVEGYIEEMRLSSESEIKATVKTTVGSTIWFALAIVGFIVWAFIIWAANN